MASFKCPDFLFNEPLGACKENFIGGNGTYSFNFSKMLCEFNGVLYGKILDYTQNSFTVERISVNKYINGSVEVINIVT